jgi:hypothetical protein
MKTIDSLGIFWTCESDGEKYQEEVNGLIFYGFWKTGFPQEILDKTDTFRKIWSDSGVEIKPRTWAGDFNANLSIEVRIDKWPMDCWDFCIEQSLKWFIEFGAQVAWCGSEYSSPSLDVFNLDESSGEIYAAYSNETGYVCRSGLLDEYQELKAEDLQKFKYLGSAR